MAVWQCLLTLVTSVIIITGKHQSDLCNNAGTNYIIRHGNWQSAVLLPTAPSHQNITELLALKRCPLPWCNPGYCVYSDWQQYQLANNNFLSFILTMSRSNLLHTRIVSGHHCDWQDPAWLCPGCRPCFCFITTQFLINLIRKLMFFSFIIYFSNQISTIQTLIPSQKKHTKVLTIFFVMRILKLGCFRIF